MSSENDVRKASEKLYAALNRMLDGDAGPLADIWSHNTTGNDHAPDRWLGSGMGCGQGSI